MIVRIVCKCQNVIEYDSGLRSVDCRKCGETYSAVPPMLRSADGWVAKVVGFGEEPTTK